MRKKVNLGLLIMTTGLVLLASAFIIAACGLGLEPETTGKSYTVTFYNGSTVVDTKTGLKDGETVTVPANPQATDYVPPAIPTAVGFYKLTTTGSVTFAGWALNSPTASVETSVVANSTITVSGSNITYYAVWTGGGSWVKTPWVSTAAATASALQKAVLTMESPNANDRFALVLGGSGLSGDEAEFSTPMNSGSVTFDKSNINLTITSTTKAQRTIKSATTLNDDIFFLIGKTSSDTTISVTLYAIKLEGKAGLDDNGNIVSANTSVVGDSLVRVRNGATLVLDGGSCITGHKNSASSDDGLNGNGSALCVINGGKLYIKDATIEKNEATTDTNNKNRVGGIYAIGSSTARPYVEINSGLIDGNKAGTNQTNDIYITEFVDFVMAQSDSLALKIGDFTINSDTDPVGSTTATPVVTTIQIPTAVKNKMKLNLRSSIDPTSLTGVQGRWENQVVLKSTNGYILTQPDLDKFELGQFRGRSALTGTVDISPTYKLELSGTGAGNTAILK